MKTAVVSGDDVAGDDPYLLSAALAALGHAATVFVRRQGRRHTETDSDACRTIPIPVGPRAAESPSDVLPYVGEWAAALERMWSEDQPDVVHAHGWLGGLAAQLAARRQRIPTVQSFLGLEAISHPSPAHGSGQGSERRRVEPLLARGASWVTVGCSADVDALARLRRSRARVSVLTSGVDVDRYSPTGPVAARTDLGRLLCMAPNPLRRHGLDIAIEALPRIPGTELVIAETGPSNPAHDDARAALRRLAAHVGVAHRVHFAGTVADAELPMLVRSADVVACTPRQPPRATAVLRAMASGVVVVAPAVGVLGDAVVDDVTGVLLANGGPGELAAAVRDLLAQRFRRESMGAAGRSRALSRFSWDRIALDALSIYRQLGSPGLAPSSLRSTVAR
ncbi:glycosyl transferase [Mycobacterium saskatchewanense]|uniref:Glycosyl transferase n=1 Tax=Mycobacterium saskatchewanense TaxID=220927 RepID=A0A1X2CBH8_9MYCO|nr:glycosyltransferase [Mycobacterium saskatchewanense]ORW73252.1 glycosyl transferase family 1 [Mycobacterium saskatchewanense]BBX65859.1 glycosyl transferase [Mycobacterium saskatchewanense]